MINITKITSLNKPITIMNTKKIIFPSDAYDFLSVDLHDFIDHSKPKTILEKEHCNEAKLTFRNKCFFSVIKDGELAKLITPASQNFCYLFLYNFLTSKGITLLHLAHIRDCNESDVTIFCEKTLIRGK